MSVAVVDTDIIIRFLTADDPQKRAACQDLFEQVEHGEPTLTTPHTVIANTVHVLRSPRLDHRPKAEITDMLTALISLNGFRVLDRQTLIAALELNGAHAKFDFSDALIISSTRQAGSSIVFSYDTDYDGFDGVTRREPE